MGVEEQEINTEMTEDNNIKIAKEEMQCSLQTITENINTFAESLGKVMNMKD